MRTLLTLTLTVLLAGTAFAQLDNSMGIFFATDLVEENTNLDPAVGTAFSAHIALLEATVFTVGGYEVGMTIDAASAPIITGVTGPNGWTNFGDNLNHLCGYQTPLPSQEDVVLATMEMLVLGTDPASFFMGPSSPSSVDDQGPAIADGANPELLYVCNYTSGPDEGGLVATLFGDGIEFPGGVATEAQSWTNVKAMFE